MPVLIRICTLLLLVTSLPLAAAKPQRIVSIGLCTDQLVLMLAERAQIASVSVWARDASMSYMIDAVGDIPLNNASVEEVIRFEPDLVLASEFVARDTVRFLRELGFRVEQTPVVTSVTQIYDLLRRFGDWTGNPRRAGAVIASMQQRIADIRQRYAERPPRTAIIYSPNGFTVGSDTLEHDLFAHAGYRNLAAEMGISGFQSIPLESLLAANPDVLLIDRGFSQPLSLATAYLGHPALKKLLLAREDLDIPTRL